MRRFRAWPILFIAVPVVLWYHRPVRAAAFTVFRFPLSVTESALSLVLHLPRLPKLLQENADLRLELAGRQLELVQLRESVRRLSQSRQLQAGFDRTSAKPAVLVARTLLPMQQVVFLNVGERDGVAQDSLLVVLEGLVGRVIDVYATTSVAQLVTDPNSRIGGLVERSRESGLVVGAGTNRCRLIYLDVDADVAVGDRVVTAGVGGPFPPGLVIGTVLRVMRDERAAQTTAIVRPAVAIHQVEEVLCLPPG